MSATAPLQPRYRLADHVRACHVDGQVILLDLRRDRYFGVGGALLPLLSPRIADWPVAEQADLHRAKEADVDQWIADMCAQDMLVTAATPLARRASVVEAQQSLFACHLPAWPGIQWRRTARIVNASFIAGRWLKHHHLAGIAGRVEHLRQTRSVKEEGGPADQLQNAVAWYLSSRPFVTTSHDQCLRDSLTLAHFLAAERLYPRWVIGVRTRPFGAHSWLQEGNLVLNDLHETVRRYTPILVV